jgi:hypothetical protein
MVESKDDSELEGADLEDGDLEDGCKRESTRVLDPSLRLCLKTL